MSIVELVALIGIFILGLFVMITCHEFGHFLACRRSGIIVEEFSIGMFGPRLLKFKRGDTTYAFRPVLIGAYVKPIGESDPDVPGGLAGQRPWVRIKVYAAGPLANIVLAFVILVMFLVVKPGFPLNSDESPWIEGDGIMVQVMEDRPAAAAGLQSGDIIVEVGDTDIRRQEDLTDALGGNGETKTITVDRKGELRDYAVTPEYDSDVKKWLIGVLPCWGSVTSVSDGSPAHDVIEAGDAILAVNDRLVYSSDSLDEALELSDDDEEVTFTVAREGEDESHTASFTMPGENTADAIGLQSAWVSGAHVETKDFKWWQSPVRSAKYFLHFPLAIKDSIPLMREDPSKALTGPVGAGQIVVEAVSLGGFALYLYLASLISIGLALFNFIPMPPLDGGGMLVALIEGIRGGKRLSASAMHWTYTIGIAIVLTLGVMIMYNDVARLIRGEKFLE